MTKTTKKQLIEEYVEKARMQYQLANDLQNKIARESRSEYLTIDKDSKLSPQGKAMEKADAQRFYQEQFLKGMSDIKRDYARYLSCAKKLAEEVVAEEPENKSSQPQIKAFESALSDLKTRVLLHPSTEKAVDLIEAFAGKYKDAYFSQKIASAFHELASPIASSQSHDIKMRTSKIYDSVKQRTITEEKVYAQEVLEADENPRFILTQHDAPSFERLRTALGRRVAEFANDPDACLARMESGETETELQFTDVEQQVE